MCVRCVTLATFSLVSGSKPSIVPLSSNDQTQSGSFLLRARSLGSSSRLESWDTSLKKIEKKRNRQRKKKERKREEKEKKKDKSGAERKEKRMR